MIGGHHHIGKVVARKATGSNRNGLLTKILNSCALRARQRWTRRAAVIERCQRALLERMLTRPLGTFKPRHQPGIGVERVGAKTANGAVNIELPCNAALVTGEPLIANLVIGDVVPGTAFEVPVFGQPDDTVLRVKLMIHSLITSRISAGSSSNSQNARSTRSPLSWRVSVKCSRPHTAGKVRVFNAILNGAAAGGMRTCCRRLFVDFHGARNASDDAS